MPSLEVILAGSLLFSLTLYVLTGGADYGGGVWDLLAWGPRAKAQRDLIAKAIGPIWEANHVWLILVIVILFTGFPNAFAAIATALHIPLTLMLIGIVLRGSAFAFRTYDPKEEERRRWGHAFAIASLITPVLLGVTLGAIMSGEIRMENGYVTTGFVHSWFALFPFAVGVFALVMFAFLAAVYLTLETEDRDLREDFRKRAIVSGVAVGIMAITVFVLSEGGAPLMQSGLGENKLLLPLEIATVVLALGALILLWKRRFLIGAACAAAQVTLILWGWAIAQFPYLVVPDITVFNSAAPQATLRLLVSALFVGALLLFPSFYYLFRVFKSKPGPTD